MTLQKLSVFNGASLGLLLFQIIVGALKTWIVGVFG
jgi:hypothetical protein